MPPQGFAVTANPPASAARIVPQIECLLIRQMDVGTSACMLGPLGAGTRSRLRVIGPAA